MVQMKESPFRLEKKGPPPKEYPHGWGSYTVNVYPWESKEATETIMFLLGWLDDIFTEHKGNVRIVAVEKTDHTSGVRFQVLVDGKEI